MKYTDYRGKNVVVTGAASGMGKATAQKLITAGANVYAINDQPFNLAGATALTCDVSDEQQVEAAFSQIPDHVDSYFGVAGISGQHSSYLKVIKVNYWANKYITEHFLQPRMKQGGSIVYVSSFGAFWWERHLAELKPALASQSWTALEKALAGQKQNPGTLGYLVSKRLLNAYSLTMVPQLSKQDVRINVIMPGPTKTGLIGEFAQIAGGLQNMVNGFTTRPSTSAEEANAMLFLNSSDASYINGVELRVDAGEGSAQILNKAPRALDISAMTSADNNLEHLLNHYGDEAKQ